MNHRTRSRTAAALVAATSLAAPLLAATTSAASAAALPQTQAASTTPPRAQSASAALPQTQAAGSASRWLASQLTAGGYLPSANGGGQADGSGTASVALALAATGSAPQQLAAALGYLAANVNTVVVDTTVAPHADNPGRLALLILLARATGSNPRSFGGTDLVARLLATARTTGSDAGLFGAADPTYDGAYRQGLSLAALSGAGITGTNATVAAATSWLQHQQCADGGWESYRADTTVACTATDPTMFSGPDTNSTALAVEGLVAQGTALGAGPATFLAGLQDGDGGWGAYGAPSDADSTALVIQALIALGQNPAASVKSGADPLDALLSFQIHGGASDGAVAFQPNTDGSLSASALASEQAAPALAGLAFPFGPQTATTSAYRLAGADGGVFAFDSSFQGSAGGAHLRQPIVAAATVANGTGYYLGASDGGVFAYNAPFHGSLGNVALRAPVVGMGVDAASGGYWLVGADGGVFSFDAPYLGGTGGVRLTRPVVGFSATPTGGGYILIASDGGVFAYGDATFAGSLGNVRLAAPIVGGAIDPTTGGYWLVAGDGGVFSFDAPYLGSTGNLKLTHPIVGMSATPGGGGYDLVASDGSVYPFGTATQAGGLTGTALSAPIVAITASAPGA